jgi:hypothetical protein
MWIKTVNRRTKWPWLPVCKTFKLVKGISMDIQMVLNETTSSHLRWGHYVGRSPASSSAQSLASTNRPAACFEQPGRTSPHFHAVEIQKWQAGWLWVCPWVTPTSTKRQPNPLSYLPWYALLKGIFYFWAAPQGYRFKWGGTKMMFDRGVQHVVATTLLDHVFVSNIDFLGTHLDAT